MNALVSRVVELSELRQSFASAAAALRAAREAFDKEHADLITQVRDRSASVQSAETALKAVALEEFTAKGDKHVAPGIEVRMFKEYAINEEQGLAWARQTGLCLIPEKLDIAAVKKIASVQTLPFVIVEDDPRVQIATDLSKVDLTFVPPTEEEIAKDFYRPDREMRTERQDQAEARREAKVSR